MWYGCGIIIEAHCPHDLVVAPIEFGGGVILERIPAWVQSEHALENESWRTRTQIGQSELVFRVVYEADALGSPDPTWKGKEPRGSQSVVDEKIWLAGLALWLVRPTSWSAGHLMHFDRNGDPQSQRSSGSLNKILVLPGTEFDPPTATDIGAGVEVHKRLLEMGRGGSVWSAIYLLGLSLGSREWLPRFVLTWVVLEALFGPEDAREMRYRISQRLAFFLGVDAADRAEIYRTSLKGYDLRSKAVHGGRLTKLASEDSLVRIREAEGLVRRALRKLLSESELASSFDGEHREAYLDGLIFNARGQ